MSVIVSKFGGSSLADTSQIRKVIDIVQSNVDRQYIVVSAPGKRNPQDRKITDLLYEWYRQQKLQHSVSEIRRIVSNRFSEIIYGLGIKFDLEVEISEIERIIRVGGSEDFAASRGEYLTGKIIAIALGYDFVDPRNCIYFNGQGSYDYTSQEKIRNELSGHRAVIPGFYGSIMGGAVKTFSRGGSDITGAIVAQAVRADLYENWTDVSGLLMADPRVVESPRKIEIVTYRELRELAYMGANVFHEEAMFPVQCALIETNIRNTNNPGDCGTRIIAEDSLGKGIGGIVGIAGRKGFTVVTVEKAMMNQQVGFVRRILTILEKYKISFEHMPSGIDTLSIIIDDEQIKGKLDDVLREVKSECSPDTIEVYRNMAMIATVGKTMFHVPGIAAKIFSAIAEKNINVRMINQGSSEISIIVGVDNTDYEGTVRAIYEAFTK